METYKLLKKVAIRLLGFNLLSMHVLEMRVFKQLQLAYV